jgi:hypothetical protein
VELLGPREDLVDTVDVEFLDSVEEKDAHPHGGDLVEDGP